MRLTSFREDINTLRVVAYLISQHERIDWTLAECLLALGWIAMRPAGGGHDLTEEGQRWLKV